jgi:hypothetical protein
MLKATSLALMAALAAAQVTGTHTSRAPLVAQCKQEANRGHLRVQRLLPELKGDVDAHRRRMTAICRRWQIVGADGAAPLLQECLAEAAGGPHVLHGGRNHDDYHTLRLRKLCRKLADIAGVLDG